jgi:transposase InsO family protein
MEVSRSQFYNYLGNLKRPDDPSEVALKVRVTAIFKEHRDQYGSRRILKQLKNEGYQIGRYKVRRLMRELGLRAKAPKRYKVTTDSRHSFPVAPNILKRKFDVDKPNTFWTADITYVWTLEGWLHLAVVFDLYSRQIVGWAMDKRMKKQLTLDALAMAYWRRKHLSFYTKLTSAGHNNASTVPTFIKNPYPLILLGMILSISLMYFGK